MLQSLYNTYLDLRQELRLSGVLMYQLEAKELLAFALGIPRNEFNERDERLIFQSDMEKIDSLKRVLLCGTPLPHIIGEWDFYGNTFEVTTNTLIPRSDSECIVSAAIDFLKDSEKGRVLDLCCGTGCIGISVLKNASEGINGVFADISDYAIRVSKNNIMKHDLTARSLTVKIDALDQYNPTIGRFGLIVCNPPYIPTQELETLDLSVKEHEPMLALDGGDDGLIFYRAIAKNYKEALGKNGAIIFEYGMGQFQAVTEILEKEGYIKIECIKDLSGVERAVIAHNKV